MKNSTSDHSKQHRRNSTILTIQISDDIRQPTHHLTHRIKKINQTEHKSSTKTSIRQTLQKIQINFFSITQPAAIPGVQPKSVRNLSSYQEYKEEQRNLRINRTMKINSLKQRYLLQKMNEKEQTVNKQTNNLKNTVPEFKKCKLNLVLLGASLSAQNQQQEKIRKSRDVYVMTSQGKRKHLDSYFYIRKIRQKQQRSSSKQNQANQQFKFKTQLQNNSIVPLNPKINSMRSTRKTQYNNFKNRNGRNRDIRNNKFDCRPWSSNKSEVFE